MSKFEEDAVYESSCSERYREPAKSVAEIEERIAALEPRLRQRTWAPMSYMLIPSVLGSADTLLAQLAAYDGPDAARVAELRAHLAALRADFRREK